MALFTILGLVCALALVQGQQVKQIPLWATSDSPITDTPGVVTNPDSNGTSTLSYQSTLFPIWSTTTIQTTQHTPTGNGTSTGTTVSTATPTSTPTPSPTTTTPTPSTSNMTTTTDQPTTPTVPVPTLPPEPVAPAFPWNATYGPKGNYCLMLSFAARIDISYMNVLNQTVQTGLDVPDNATVNTNKSSCEPGKNTEMFVLEFAPMGQLTVIFHRDQSNNDSTIFKVQTSLLVTEDLFPGIESAYIGKMVTLGATNLTMFDTEPAHSYSCVSLIKTNLTSVRVHDDKDTNSPFQFATLETSNLKVQAFMPSDQKINTFLPDTTCPQDKTDISSTIPITVGVILLVMVVVVLIAYFIGRSRQQKETTAI